MRNVVPGRRSSYLVAVLVLLTLVLSAGTALAQDANQSTQQSIPNVNPVYFPFNIYNRVTDASVLKNDGDVLSQNQNSQLWIQGYADVRGDIFYNLVLSYRRAQFVKSQLVKAGVDESKIQFATGWGKLYPVCQQNDDSCYQQQRRVDIIPPDHM